MLVNDALTDPREMETRDASVVLREVGRRVAELRQGQGLTQEALAEQLGFTVKYLQRVEAGRENLTIRSLVRFADVLGVDLPELFTPPRSMEVRTGRPPSPKA